MGGEGGREVKTKGFIKPLALGWIRGRREKVREAYRFEFARGGEG